MPIEHPDPIWVRDNETLAQLSSQWLELDAIALDSEFIRTDTFYPIPGLIQLGTGDSVYLLDPLEIDNWAPFAEVLTRQSLVKVLHACGEDLEVFHILTGVRPVSLVDTQLAAAYVGLGHSMGYQNLLKTLLQVDLPKDATRSNWLQRPLSDSQISYATLDVVHLLEAWMLMYQELAESPRFHWLMEDCQKMTAAPLQPEPGEVWKDVKRAWQLRPQQRAVLQQVCEYREREARQRNRPRNRVIPKAALWPIARYLPDNTRSLSSIPDMNHKILKHDGEKILELIATAQTLPEAECPPPLPAPLPKAAKDYGKFIKAYAQEKASELNIPVELLLPGKMTSPILRKWLDKGAFSLPESLNGWRREVIGTPLIRALKEIELNN